MLPRIDIGTLGFGQPLYLWLLVVPGVLLALGVWRVLRRRLDVRRSSAVRISPVAPGHPFFGDVGVWLSLVWETSHCIHAIARPKASTGEIGSATCSDRGEW